MLPLSTYTSIYNTFRIGSQYEVVPLKDRYNAISWMYKIPFQNFFNEFIIDGSYFGSDETAPFMLNGGFIVDYFEKEFSNADVEDLSSQVDAGQATLEVFETIRDSSQRKGRFYRVATNLYVGMYPCSEYVTTDASGIDSTSLCSIPNVLPCERSFEDFKYLIRDKNDSSMLEWGNTGNGGEPAYIIKYGDYSGYRSVISKNAFIKAKNTRRSPWGWHMITNWEWSLLNSYVTRHAEYEKSYGADFIIDSTEGLYAYGFPGAYSYDLSLQYGVPEEYEATPFMEDTSRTYSWSENVHMPFIRYYGYNYAGTGPVQYNYGSQFETPSDLVGNIWEMVDGVFLCDTVKNGYTYDPDHLLDDYRAYTLLVASAAKTSYQDITSTFYDASDMLWYKKVFFYNGFLDYTSPNQYYGVDDVSHQVIPEYSYIDDNCGFVNPALQYGLYSDASKVVFFYDTFCGYFKEDSGADHYSLSQLDCTNDAPLWVDYYPEWDEDDSGAYPYSQFMWHTDTSVSTYNDDYKRYQMILMNFAHSEYNRYINGPRGIFYCGLEAVGGLPPAGTSKKYVCLRGGSFNTMNMVLDASMINDTSIPDGMDASSDFTYNGLSTVSFLRSDWIPLSEDSTWVKNRYGRIGTRLAYWDIKETVLVFIIDDETA